MGAPCTIKKTENVGSVEQNHPQPSHSDIYIELDIYKAENMDIK